MLGSVCFKELFYWVQMGIWYLGNGYDVVGFVNGLKRWSGGRKQRDR